MLDAHQLNVFLVAAETLNFTQAAQRLQMSQPSVSQHIQALEKYFRIKLFSRSSRSLHLTPEGLSLIPLAREMVRQSIVIEETMESMKGGVYGHLRVGCSTTPGKYILPHLLANFHQLYERVKITCEVSSQMDAIQKLCDREIHIAMTSYENPSCNDVEFISFMCEKVTLIVPPSHPWASRVSLNPDELCQVDFIHREETSGTYQAAKKALVTLGIHMGDLRTLLTLGNSEAIALAVQEGLGVGFISQTVVDKLVPGKVVPVQINGLDICRDIFISHNVRGPSSKAQEAFWDFICQQPLPITNLDYFKSDNQ